MLGRKAQSDSEEAEQTPRHTTIQSWTHDLENPNWTNSQHCVYWDSNRVHQGGRSHHDGPVCSPISPIQGVWDIETNCIESYRILAGKELRNSSNSQWNQKSN